jgi:hypothetical protein
MVEETDFLISGADQFLLLLLLSAWHHACSVRSLEHTQLFGVEALGSSQRCILLILDVILS